MITAVIYYLYIVLLQNPRNNWVAFIIVVANISLLLSNYFGLLVIVNQGIILLFYLKNKLLRNKILLIISATVIFSSPILFLLVKQYLISSKGTWVPTLVDGVFQNFIDFSFNGRENFNLYFYILTASILAFGVRVFRNKTFDISYLKEIFILLFCFLFPYLSMFVLSFSSPCFLERYLLFNSIALYLFIGVAIGKFLNPFDYLQIIALSAITIFAYKNMFFNSKTFYHREIKSAVNKCITYKDAQTIIFIHPAWNVSAFAYYYNLKYFNDIKSDEIKILEPENIYGVYSFDEATQILEKSKSQFQTVIYYTDGTNFESPFNKIPLDTSRNFIRIDSAFYPQCTNVMVYKKLSSKN